MAWFYITVRTHILNWSKRAVKWNSAQASIFFIDRIVHHFFDIVHWNLSWGAASSGASFSITMHLKFNALVAADMHCHRILSSLNFVWIYWRIRVEAMFKLSVDCDTERRLFWKMNEWRRAAVLVSGWISMFIVQCF